MTLLMQIPFKSALMMQIPFKSALTDAALRCLSPFLMRLPRAFISKPGFAALLMLPQHDRVR